jgi:hypothetical protein
MADASHATVRPGGCTRSSIQEEPAGCVLVGKIRMSGQLRITLPLLKPHRVLPRRGVDFYLVYRITVVVAGRAGAT